MLKPWLTLAKTGVAFVHNLLTDPERMRADLDAIDVFADQDGGLIATWMFDRMGVIQENTRQDEGNAYARLGEFLQCLGARTKRGSLTRRASGRPRSSATGGWPKTCGSHRSAARVGLRSQPSG